MKILSRLIILDREIATPFSVLAQVAQILFTRRLF